MKRLLCLVGLHLKHGRKLVPNYAVPTKDVAGLRNILAIDRTYVPVPTCWCGRRTG